jgi:hypothetical protein
MMRSRKQVIVRNALSESELATANEAIDRMAPPDYTAQKQEATEGEGGDFGLLLPSPSYSGSSTALSTDTGITRLGNTKNLMQLPSPFCNPFRTMLAHPNTTPHLNAILGEGWRLDHGPGLIAMDQGCSGGGLHGGAVIFPSCFPQPCTASSPSDSGSHPAGRPRPVGAVLLQELEDLHRLDCGRVPPR